MITRDSIEQAYSFFHQKWNVYRGQHTNGRQRDDIEYAIGSYAEAMNPELYRTLSGGNPGYLKEHCSFASDLENAVKQLETLL